VRFEDTDELRSAEFVNVDLSQARFRNVDLSGAKVMEARLVNARLSGLIDGLIVNDVEVAPLIVAEMARRHPERTKLSPVDARGVSEAWAVIESLWQATKDRALRLPEPVLRQRVDDEWSFLETLRHLVFVTDLWIVGPVLGRTGEFHPLGLPPSFMTDVAAFGIDPGLRADIDDVIAAREDRMATVGALIGGLGDDDLERRCRDGTVLSCLCTVFDEEWYHNWFANRDLDVLTGAASAKWARSPD
jgi:hypothetical protein